MKVNVEKSMKQAITFYEANKDYVLNQFDGLNELFGIELDSKRLGTLFDQYAGIDYVLLNKKLGQMFGIAARVNFWHKTKGHLTIRYSRPSGVDTEYQKRMRSVIRGGSMYPQITMQIDGDKNSLKAEGGILISTQTLYEYLNKNDVINKYINCTSEGQQYLSIPYEFINANKLIKSKIII